MPLPTLLAAMRDGNSYIQLDDGSQGMLPEKWLQRYGRLAELAETNSAALRFRSSQALFLDAHVTDLYDIEPMLDDFIEALEQWLPGGWTNSSS